MLDAPWFAFSLFTWLVWIVFGALIVWVIILARKDDSGTSCPRKAPRETPRGRLARSEIAKHGFKKKLDMLGGR